LAERCDKIVLMRMPTGLHLALKKAAAQDDRSEAGYLRLALRDRLQKDGVKVPSTTTVRG
jgi:hypothetical protein